MSAELSEARRTKRISEKYSGTTCFACRSVGHAARDCPNVLLAASGGGEGSAGLLSTGEGTTGTAGRGMKRKAGKNGGEVTGGRCYR